jgi:hypothetical protein
VPGARIAFYWQQFRERLMAKPRSLAPEVIERRILLIRGHKVLLSIDLAGLYEAEHKVLMQAVRRTVSDSLMISCFR